MNIRRNNNIIIEKYGICASMFPSSELRVLFNPYKEKYDYIERTVFEYRKNSKNYTKWKFQDSMKSVFLHRNDFVLLFSLTFDFLYPPKLLDEISLYTKQINDTKQFNKTAFNIKKLKHYKYKFEGDIRLEKTAKGIIFQKTYFFYSKDYNKLYEIYQTVNNLLFFEKINKKVFNQYHNFLRNPSYFIENKLFLF